MKELCFYTDHKLRICSWGKEMSEFTGQPADSVMGNEYFTVFPRIYNGNKDALACIIRAKKPLLLKNHAFYCFFGSLTADVKIKPAKSADKKTSLIKVTLHPHTTCAMSKKLLQSKKLSDIGKIASTLAHGVRNPLNAIKGAVVYLREKYVAEDTLLEFTKIMEEEISRLEVFISNFLNSSVSETEDSETDINALLRKIEIFTSLQIYTRNIRTYYEFGKIPPITINAFHLEQAILNVINNALEAMQSNGQLDIKSFTAERSGKYFVAVSISDTGPGMPDRKPDEYTPGSENNGRGFGQLITHEILNHYGGHIEFDSKINVGTTVTLFIPCQQREKQLP